MHGRVEYPTKHISIRVPWHDNEWNGQICENPHLNNSCTILKRIAEEKFDAREEENAGKSIDNLEERIWPPCVHERGMFMSPFDFTATMLHPYKRFSKLHKHFKETYFHMSAHSASAVPFRWMLKSNLNQFAEEYGLDCSDEYEPDIGFHSSFTQGYHNQKTLLDTFFGHVKPDESLCFFYAKNVPFVEERGRVLIGVGKVKKIAPSMEHLRISDDGIKSMIWERNIQHSIREGFDEGFILPYNEILEYCNENSDLDPSEIAVVVPDDHRPEFSFASEFVTPDAAINVLLQTIKSLDKIKEHIPGPWKKCQNWIDEQLGELWKLRGPYPGLGSVLRSFGIDLGNMIANEVNQMAKSGEDHWNILDEVFKNPPEYLPENLAMQIGRLYQKKWSKLSDERKSFLKLMSRFEIDIDQAKMFYNYENRENELILCEDKEIIENPYLLYELSRFHPNFINFWRVDYGLFPDVSISKNYPIPEPSKMDYRLDERRIRAVLIYILELASREGHTLLPVAHLIDKINKLSIEPPFEIDSETLEIVEDDFEDLISVIKLKDGKKAYKLRYLEEMSNIIKKTVEDRLSQEKILLNQNWRKLIDDVFDNDPLLNKKVDPVMEEEARKEKAKALEVLVQSRVSVLIGPAGTGKTKLLSVLCSQEDIKNEDILLLAPTGKARVKIEEGIRHLGLKAQTMAQFLIKQDRFYWETGRYHLSDKKKISKAKTIIVDEASMISEDMLAALLDSLKGFKRLILVGDPNQLPPIGPGRPFVDIIKKINHATNSGEIEYNSVFELTVNIRHIDPDKDGKDLELAKWFSEDVPSSDDLSRIINKDNYSNCIAFKKWDSQDDFRDLILNSLVNEIAEIKSSKDYDGFNKSLGAVKEGKWTNYNANGIENWQILSPVRNHTHGVMEINRFIHKRFRGGLINDLRTGKIKNSLKPLGNEEIIGGDKVINVLNHQRWCSDIDDYTDKSMGYIANGEIGVVYGAHKKYGVNIQFSTQKYKLYGFPKFEFSEEISTLLELAYALTVHKAQGSDFKKVFLVIPKKCSLISKELIYTALTRHKESVMVLYEGDPNDILKYSSDFYSETAKRFTDLFKAPSIIEIEEKYFEESLIHGTLRGEMVRSKSEVIIANILYDNQIDYDYEKKLFLDDEFKIPDFTIESSDGETTYYWEHLGMLKVPEYQAKWDKKKEWYIKNDILPYKDGGGKKGTLIITVDDEKGGISSQEIEKWVEIVSK